MNTVLNRRTVIASAATLAAAPLLRPFGATAQEAAEPLDELTILLSAEPPTLDPALTYQANGWSIVHSVYDSLVNTALDGTIEPLLAESWAQPDPLTLDFRLRAGVTFHDGTPLESAAVVATYQHVVDPAVASQIAGNFVVVERVEAVDPLTVRFVLNTPAPALFRDIATWIAVMAPAAIADPTSPVGTGPYRFVAWERGESVTLEVNPAWYGGAKGQPIADRVVYRFVTEASTRVAELRVGGAGIVRDVPQDQVGVVEDDGARVEAAPVSGVSFIRIATDAEPFGDVRVRQAINHAVDVDTIVQALSGGNGRRLATLLAPSSLGYDPDLAPYTYDPDRARELLAQAGYGDGFETTMDVAATDRLDIPQAVAGQLGEVGISVGVQTVESARFNETWQDPASAPLRFVTWRPMFDPATLFGLVVSGEGFLSRYANPEVDALIAAAETEIDPAVRAEQYRQAGQLLHDDPAGIYLSDPVALYGLAPEVTVWTPRPDEYILPLVR